MKKHTFSTIILGAITLFLCSFNGAYAQVNYGLRAGVSLSTFSNNPFSLFDGLAFNSSNSFFASPDLAGFVNFSVSSKLSIQSEIHWLEKGGIRKESYIFRPSGASVDETVEAKVSYQVNFVEIPLLIKYQVVDLNVQLSFLAGGSIGQALSQRFKGDNTTYFADTETVIYSGSGEKIAWDNDFGTNRRKDNRTDLSAIVGLELAKNIGKRNLLFDLRYSHDFTSWRTFEQDNNRKEVLYRSILATIGVEF